MNPRVRGHSDGTNDRIENNRTYIAEILTRDINSGASAKAAHRARNPGTDHVTKALPSCCWPTVNSSRVGETPIITQRRHFRHAAKQKQWRQPKANDAPGGTREQRDSKHDDEEKTFATKKKNPKKE